MTPFKWPRKLTKAKLRERGIYNTHGFLRSGEPAIDYRGRESGSGWAPHGWRLWVRDRPLPGPWYEHGAKTFSLLRGGKDGALAEAMAYAADNFNVREWVRTPFGSYVPREVAERVAETTKGGSNVGQG